ncbi:MAG: LysM peptidoglycan-binding domain-containing protein [Dehalococcoidia bacterium]|nr:MAG: LysM peptidoglycan-binding domain-containing protein [Dehalococcoidia bacterium]
MHCYACDEQATQECARCGALYCDNHGDALCDRCMDPASAVPSYRVFRGSLAALLIGSIVAVWLLVLPPARADQDGPPSSIANLVQTGTPRAASSATATPGAAEGTPAASTTPGASATPTRTPSPTATATPSPTPTATPTPAATPIPRDATTYTVAAGDTLSSIAQRFTPPGGNTQDVADAIAKANNITDPRAIQIGQKLNIPAR